MGGAGCGLVGFFLSHLKLPFMGVCLSHAALAGAVFAELAGLPVLPVAFLVALLASFLVGLMADRARIDVNLSMCIIFSLMMGLAFIGIGLAPGPRTGMLNLIWGSVLLVSRADITRMSVAVVVAGSAAWAFSKELKAVLFNREIAAASGIHHYLAYYLLLIVSGLVVTVNLETVGGLMLFSLLVAPPATASRLCRKYWPTVVTSTLLGSIAALTGLGISYVLNAPTGASIVVTSTSIFLLVHLVQKLRGKAV